MLIIRRFLVFNIVFLIVFFALIKMLFWYNFQPTGHFMYRVPHNSHYGDIIATSRREIELEFAVNENIRVPVDKIRNVIVTTWRSGSTFLGEIFNEMSGNYYHYEPLMDFEIRQVRQGFDVERALYQLSDLFDCNYRVLEQFVDYARHHDYVFTHNTRLWAACNRNNFSTLCYNDDFLSDFCAIHPYQSMKLVRLRLNLIEPLIKKYHLNVIFLVRDPRGVMESRKHRDWCPGNSDCDNATYLCNDMVEDYQAMMQFQEKFSDNFRFVKFEDMASDPQNYTKRLFESLRLDFTPRIQSYIEMHSKYNSGGVSSTFRDSKTIPFMWKEKLTLWEILDIEKQCTEALRLYNYSKVD